jgi:hypothetical protein
VIGLLALIAAIATPASTKNSLSMLDVAAAEVADAVRFARNESIRTGTPYGIYANQTGQQIRVYRLLGSTPTYDVYDPFTKQPYDLTFGSGMANVSIQSVYFKFENTLFPTSYLGFSEGNGTPKYNGGGTIRMLETAYIRLSLDGELREINVAPMTGRVTLQ